MKWVAAATAPTQTQAEVWQNMLMDAGIAATVHPGDTLMPSYLGLSPKPCRVMVSEEDLQSAQDVLASVSVDHPQIDPDLPEQ